MTITLSKRQNGNPVSRVDNLINSVFHDGLQQIVGDSFWHDVPCSTGNVPVNVRETNKEYQIDLVTPGCQKEDFNVNISEKLLTVNFSSKQAENQGGTVSWTHNEFVQSSFSKNFMIDDSVDVNNITATYQNGILRISLPKNEPPKSSVKQIEIK
jgi:HSP20 family protein